MARMIPGSGPRDFDERSHEGDVYQALESLPDDYVVIHSMDLVTLDAGFVRQNEADFVVFNRNLGILCIEVKAGQVSYRNGDWYYGSGIAMAHGGPVKQAERCKYRLRDVLESKGLSRIKSKCKMCHAVWFPSCDRVGINTMALPPELLPELILGKEDLLSPEMRINAIFAHQGYGITTELSFEDEKKLLKYVLCPEFNLVPSRRISYDLSDVKFLRLLSSQARVLDFIQEQRSAVINGAAGTGKTLIALERARRASVEGEKVLFLCFNALMKDYLSEKCSSDNSIKVVTIAGFACSVCGSSEPDYDSLAEKLMEMADGSFPYDHVVIDEGQDFGVKEIDDAAIMELLRECVLAKPNGTFCVFYDKRQFVQGSTMPSVINDADCKLTLYVNCRNTQSIALCSMRSISEEGQAKVRQGVIEDAPVMMFASKDVSLQSKYVNSQISELKEAGLSPVVLTCKTESRSVLRDCFSRKSDGSLVWSGTSVPVYSCRRFKGLEADAVILIDVSDECWAEQWADYNPSPGLVFYTGASRAKHELRIVCDMDNEAAERVLRAFGIESKRKPTSRLAKRLNANLVERV